ncbi:MAG: hypothetical protein QMD92_06990 [bacterium]|nr:hypothetical protein [bacterium]
MEENKLSSYLAWTAFFTTGAATLFYFLNRETVTNLILVVLYKSTIAYFIFKYLGLGIEKLLKWKVPQLYNPNAANQGENIDFVIPAETPNNNLIAGNIAKEKGRKE